MFPQQKMCGEPDKCLWMLKWSSQFQGRARPDTPCERALHQVAVEALHRTSWAEVKDILRRYCLAVAAKDCSIIVSYTTQCEAAAAPSMQRPVMDCDACKNDADRLRCMLEPAKNQAPADKGGERLVHTCIGSVRVGQQMVRYRVGVVDMDRKSIGKVESHQKLDQEILQAWNREHTAGSRV